MSVSHSAPGFRQFAAWCKAEAEQLDRHGGGYAERATRRFYDTYRICSRYLPPGGKVLSAGAGGAFVEKQLCRTLDAQVTVLDFPQALAAHAADYGRYRFQGIGLDLVTDWRLEMGEAFDLAVSLEVTEHLPIPPRQHIASLARHLKPGGHLVLTTPNLGRLSNLVRLSLGRPILADPELVFLPTAYEREHVHRRDYVAAELVAAVRRAGLTHVKTEYSFYLAKGGPAVCAWRLAGLLAPRLKNILVIIARKDAAAARAAA